MVIVNSGDVMCPGSPLSWSKNVLTSLLAFVAADRLLVADRAGGRRVPAKSPVAVQPSP